MTTSYQISKDMDIETMPHAMYFTGDPYTVTKINHIPYQTIVLTTNFPFYIRIPDQKVILLYIQEEV